MKIMKTNLNNIAKLYITILSYPSVIKLKPFKQLFIFMILIVPTLLLTTGFINNINYDIIKVIIINFTLLYFLFIILNLMVRIYNMLVRVSHYFIQSSHLDRSLIIGYYIYNLLGILLTSILLYKLEFSLIQYDPTIINYIYIYIFFTIIISLIYIDYISGLELQINSINITKLTHLFICVNISLILLCFINALKLTFGEFILSDKELLKIFTTLNYYGAESSSSGSLNQNSQEISIRNQMGDRELESHRADTPVPDILLLHNNNVNDDTVTPTPRGRRLERGNINDGSVTPTPRGRRLERGNVSDESVTPTPRGRRLERGNVNTTSSTTSSWMIPYLEKLRPYHETLCGIMDNQRWIFFQYHPGLDVASMDLQIEGLRRIISHNITADIPIPTIIRELQSRQIAEFKRIVTIESMYKGISPGCRPYHPPKFGYNMNQSFRPSHLDRPSNWPGLRSVLSPRDLERKIKLHRYTLKIYDSLEFYNLYRSWNLPQSRENIPLLSVNTFLQNKR
uniref:Uncharacterized protein n=1 Tax=Tricholoma saponaceum TaxID=113602 RepID=A0A6C0W685_9AGAR|nr:hypothetical protein [Tricholoma saponaceum]QIC20282.1 hypothetical protein [Tricholoma saponaceum]